MVRFLHAHVLYGIFLKLGQLRGKHHVYVWIQDAIHLSQLHPQLNESREYCHTGMEYILGNMVRYMAVVVRPSDLMALHLGHNAGEFP